MTAGYGARPMTAAEIAIALGGRRAGLGRWLTHCPVHDDRTPSLSLADGERGLLVKCWAGCDARDVLAWLKARGMLAARFGDSGRPRSHVECGRQDDAHRREWARRLWCDADDPRGTLAEKYLAGRLLRLDDDLVGRVLRFHPRCGFGPRIVPALLARFSPIENDPGDDTTPIAILRVGLTAEGEKLGPGGEGKKMLGRVAGAAIKLNRDEDRTYGLGVTEGLEDALDVWQRGWRPVRCLGSAGAVKTFPVLSGIDALTIFADADPEGINAARACARRWRAAGRDVAVLLPRGAKDWNGAGR